MNAEHERRALKEEIEALEQKLCQQKSRLAALEQPEAAVQNGVLSHPSLIEPGSVHAILLLSDSALPLGSFAYSSGLESFLSHRKYAGQPSKLADFQKFLHLSLSSVAFTTIPYCLAAYHDPSALKDLDNDIDASTPCTVARRASVAQGRALLGVWERAFRSSWTSEPEAGAALALRSFSQEMKLTMDANKPITEQANGHFGPIWGATCCAMGLDAYQTAYIFLVNHAKAVLSAAVRASVMGPYQAQNLLAGNDVQKVIADCIEKAWNVSPEDAGQVVPAIDLWVGRHELLYSRIFNS